MEELGSDPTPVEPVDLVFNVCEIPRELLDLSPHETLGDDIHRFPLP